MMLPISSLPDTGDGADQPTARAKGGLLELGFLPYTVFAQAANDRAETVGLLRTCRSRPSLRGG